MDQRLNDAAETGDIDALYELLGQNQFILETVDKIPFIDTPLHVAVLKGQTHFALEIAMLKPSFVRKLNQAGRSPMHLALTKGDVEITRGLLEIDNTLVRVKGREGRTPLHDVVIAGNTDLLCEFLSACPESIQERTNRRETAIHLAVKNKQLRALEVLVEWVGRLKKEHLNWMNDESNTVLHRAMLTNQHQPVDLLNATNSNGLTALDEFEHHSELDREIEEILRRAGARKAQDIKSTNQVRSKDWNIVRYIKFDWLKYFQYQRGRDSPNDVRNALLVVAVLIATATYEAGLNPPGGVWQDDKTSNYQKTGTSVVIAEEVSEKVARHAGQVIMGRERFLLFAFFNSAGFYTSLTMMFILTIGFPMRELLIFSLLSLLVTYISSMIGLSGQDEPGSVCVILFLLTLPAIYTLATVSMMMSFQFKVFQFLKKLRGSFYRCGRLAPRDGRLGSTTTTSAA